MYIVHELGKMCFNDRSIKTQGYNIHKYCSKIYLTDNKLLCGMYRIVEVNFRLSFIMHYKMRVVTYVVGKKTCCA